MQIFITLAVPLILALLPIFLKKNKTLGTINAIGYFAVLASALSIIINGTGENISIFYVDALSRYFFLIIAVIDFASALYSISFIQNRLDEKVISIRQAAVYYSLFNLFSFSMFFVTVLNNLGIMWVAIEMTTLASAFLVGFYNTKKSVEAAWKYIIICSVGITLALLGTIFFYYTVSVHGGVKSLNWTDMMMAAKQLDPKILKIAFIFIVIGYGTKAGLAPMHTWLPDAHSQSLASISALLSGVLLKISIYAIIRFMIIVNTAIGTQFTGQLLILFGIASLTIAAGFMIVQRDIKRLLAYSSIEHIGIITLGLGLGGPIGLYAALLHAFNHAVTKSLMFFGAGNVVNKYKNHSIRSIHGVIHTMPFVGVFLIIGAFALGGSPPFSIFVSEIILLISGFTRGYYLISSIFFIMVAAVFSSLLYHFSKVIFGKKPENITVTKTPVSCKAAFIFLFAFIFVFGLMIPETFDKFLQSAIGIINGL